MKKAIYLLPIFALGLGACASTGSMGGSAELTPLLVANQPGDANLTCDQINAEITSMNTLIAQSEQNAINASNSGAAAGAAGSVAVNAALYSGVLGSVPGLGMAANAASGMAKQQAEAEAARQAENARNAQMRRTALMGISSGKRC